jgi:hypothetical protein
MWQAALASRARLMGLIGEEVDLEPHTSHAAADVIFRTLFTIPIEHEIASAVFEEFRNYQRSQPILNLAAFIPLPNGCRVPIANKPATAHGASAI